MTHAKRDARHERPESFIRAGGGSAPQIPFAEGEGFLDRWLARHFTVSVRLFDIRRGVEGRGPDAEAPSPETEKVLEDLEAVQDVLFELRELATTEPAMQVDAIENAVSAVYGWLEETLDAVERTGAAFRRSPSFVDAGEGSAPIAMLRAFERLHPDIEILVAHSAPVADPDLAQKLALCFRQVGAAIVRVSGRGATSLPPPSDTAPTSPPSAV